jgi:potassium-transporting ATPase KdpC subunit
MKKTLIEQIRPAVLLFIILSLITGVLYPLCVTGIARAFFLNKAEGSLICRNGKPVGSSLVGQPFDDPKYLWGRLSATSPVSFNGASSSGSNSGPSNPALLEAVKARVSALRAADPGNKDSIPVDLVTSSASGLDPHISLAAAIYQIPRVARSRGLSQEVVKSVVGKYTSGRFLGVIGEPVVHVLEVNLALDGYLR